MSGRRVDTSFTYSLRSIGSASDRARRYAERERRQVAAAYTPAYTDNPVPDARLDHRPVPPPSLPPPSPQPDDPASTHLVYRTAPRAYPAPLFTSTPAAPSHPFAVSAPAGHVAPRALKFEGAEQAPVPPSPAATTATGTTTPVFKLTPPNSPPPLIHTLGAPPPSTHSAGHAPPSSPLLAHSPRVASSSPPEQWATVNRELVLLREENERLRVHAALQESQWAAHLQHYDQELQGAHAHAAAMADAFGQASSTVEALQAQLDSAEATAVDARRVQVSLQQAERARATELATLRLEMAKATDIHVKRDADHCAERARLSRVADELRSALHQLEEQHRDSTAQLREQCELAEYRLAEAQSAARARHSTVTSAAAQTEPHLFQPPAGHPSPAGAITASAPPPPASGMRRADWLPHPSTLSPEQQRRFQSKDVVYGKLSQMYREAFSRPAPSHLPSHAAPSADIAPSVSSAPPPSSPVHVSRDVLHAQRDREAHHYQPDSLAGTRAVNVDPAAPQVAPAAAHDRSFASAFSPVAATPNLRDTASIITATAAAAQVPHQLAHLKQPQLCLDDVRPPRVPKKLREIEDYEIAFWSVGVVPPQLRLLCHRDVIDGANALAETYKQPPLCANFTSPNSVPRLEHQIPYDSFQWDADFRALLYHIASTHVNSVTKPVSSYDSQLRAEVMFKRSGSDWVPIVAQFRMSWETYLSRNSYASVYESEHAAKHAIEMLTSMVTPPVMREFVLGAVKNSVPKIKTVQAWFNLLTCDEIRLAYPGVYRGLSDSASGRAHTRSDHARSESPYSPRRAYDKGRRDRHPRSRSNSPAASVRYVSASGAAASGDSTRPTRWDGDKRPPSRGTSSASGGTRGTSNTSRRSGQSQRSRRGVGFAGTRAPTPARDFYALKAAKSGFDKRPPPRDGCFGCHSPDHWLDLCPTTSEEKKREIKRSLRESARKATGGDTRAPRGSARMISRVHGIRAMTKGLFASPCNTLSHSDGPLGRDDLHHDGNLHFTVGQQRAPFCWDSGATHNFVSAPRAEGLHNSREHRLLDEPFPVTLADSSVTMMATHTFTDDVVLVQFSPVSGAITRKLLLRDVIFHVITKMEGHDDPRDTDVILIGRPTMEKVLGAALNDLMFGASPGAGGPPASRDDTSGDDSSDDSDDSDGSGDSDSSDDSRRSAGTSHSSSAHSPSHTHSLPSAAAFVAAGGSTVVVTPTLAIPAASLSPGTVTTVDNPAPATARVHQQRDRRAPPTTTTTTATLPAPPVAPVEPPTSATPTPPAHRPPTRPALDVDDQRELRQLEHVQPTIGIHDAASTLAKLRAKMVALSAFAQRHCTASDQRATEKFIQFVLTDAADAFREHMCLEEHAVVVPSMPEGVVVEVDVEKFNALRFKPRTYSREISEVMHAYMTDLVNFKLAVHDPLVTFASPIHCFRKPGAPAKGHHTKTHRITVDLREVNACTRKVIAPLPKIANMRTYLHGMRYFGKLDLNNGFWQLLLHPSCRRYFAMSTDRGTWVPTRLIQGSVNAAGPFHQAMAEILGDLVWTRVLLYVDDVLIMARTWPEFLDTWAEVLRRFQRYHVKIQVDKTTFVALEIEFLGRMVSSEGIGFPEKFVTTLRVAPIPINAAQLRTVLMKFNWMRDAIPRYTSAVAPFQELLTRALQSCPGKRRQRDAEKVQLRDHGWNEEFTRQYEELRDQLINFVRLTHVEEDDSVWDTCVFADASDKCWSGLATQRRKAEAAIPMAQQRHRPLGFASGRFTESQLKWAIVDKEAYATKETCMSLRHLLDCVPSFIIYTDHRNLAYMFQPLSTVSASRVTSDRIQRMNLAMSVLNYRIEPISGDDNFTADWFSRWGNPAYTDSSTAPARAALVTTRAQARKQLTGRSATRPESNGDPRAPSRRDATVVTASTVAPAVSDTAPPTAPTTTVATLNDTAAAPINTTAAAHIAPSSAELSTEGDDNHLRLRDGSSVSTRSDGRDSTDSALTTGSALRRHDVSDDDTGIVPSVNEVNQFRLEDAPSEEEIIAMQRYVSTDDIKRFRLTRDTEHALRSIDGMLYVPHVAGLRPRLCIAAHAGSTVHRATDTTVWYVEQYAYWPGMRAYIRAFCRACLSCAKTRGGKVVPRPILSQVMASFPNEIISFDYAQVRIDETTRDSPRYVLVIVDNFSKFVRLTPAVSTDANTVVEALLDWFAAFGVCTYWVSDRGSHFKNQLLTRLAEVYGVHHHFTTAYAPWSNGMVERVNRELREMLSLVMLDRRARDDAWVQYLPVVTHAINTAKSSTLGGLSPFEAFLGRKSVSPLLSVFYPSVPAVMSVVASGDRVQRAVTTLRATLDSLHTHVSVHRRRYARARESTIDINVGDYVLMSRGIGSDRARDKTKPIWLGPFQVRSPAAGREHVFDIRDIITGGIVTVHARFLKRYAPRELALPDHVLETVAYGTAGSVPLAVVGHEIHNGQLYLRVLWESDEESLEEVQRLDRDVPRLVTTYFRSLPTEFRARVDRLRVKH